jgi:hypothetical protein
MYCRIAVAENVENRGSRVEKRDLGDGDEHDNEVVVAGIVVVVGLIKRR